MQMCHRRRPSIWEIVYVFVYMRKSFSFSFHFRILLLCISIPTERCLTPSALPPNALPFKSHACDVKCWGIFLLKCRRQRLWNIMAAIIRENDLTRRKFYASKNLLYDANAEMKLNQWHFCWKVYGYSVATCVLRS